MLTLPITVASNERSFSKLKLIKNQERIQKISEGVAITIKKRFSKRIRGARTPLFSFLPRKN